MIKFLKCFCLIITIHCPAIYEAASKDNNLSQAAVAVDDTSKITTYLRISDSFQNYDYNKKLEYAYKALVLSRKMHLKKEEAAILEKLDSIYTFKSSTYKSTLEKIEQEKVSLELDNKKKDDIIKDKQVLQLGLIIVTLLVFVFAICVIFIFIQYSYNNKLLKQKTEEVSTQNARLEQQNHLLEKLNQEKNGLIGIVSHDLKAPMGRIEGLLNLIRQEGHVNENQSLYLEIAHKELSSSKELIKRILDSEFKELEDESFTLEDINLNNFLTEIISSYSHWAAKKSINFHKTFEGDINLRTDKSCLSRIIDNLLSNALKFSANNKSVFISLKRLENDVVINIKDEGPGFTEDDKKKLFKKYQKLSAIPTDGENSTGLGLHIVKKLTEELGGNIELKSKTGEGSTFTLKLKEQ